MQQAHASRERRQGAGAADGAGARWSTTEQWFYRILARNL